MKSHKNAPEIPAEDRPALAGRLPWEQAAEYNKFHFFLFCGPKRSVRRAYRLYCKASGIKPKKNPPSSWYRLARGEYLAFRRAERKSNAIQRAIDVHGRETDWQRIEMIAALEYGKYPPEFAGVMVELMRIDLIFEALAIDLNGDPIPGRPTWDERKAAYWAAVERGEVDPPSQ